MLLAFQYGNLEMSNSSAIAIGMKNLGIKGVETFSANYKHLPQKHLPLTDETNYQAAVKNATGYNHNFVSLENISPLESLEKLYFLYVVRI